MLGFARLLAGQAQFEQAVKLFSAMDALKEPTGIVPSSVDRKAHERQLAALRAQLPADIFSAAWDDGRALTLAQAIGLAQASADSSSPPPACTQADRAHE